MVHKHTYGNKTIPPLGDPERPRRRGTALNVSELIGDDHPLAHYWSAAVTVPLDGVRQAEQAHRNERTRIPGQFVHVEDVLCAGCRQRFSEDAAGTACPARSIYPDDREHLVGGDQSTRALRPDKRGPNYDRGTSGRHTPQQSPVIPAPRRPSVDS